MDFNESSLRFNLSSTTGEILLNEVDMYQVSDCIGELLLERISFSPILQPYWNENDRSLEVFMHSDNWEDEEWYEENYNSIEKCTKLGFSELCDTTASTNICSYLNLTIVNISKETLTNE